jgi:Ni/Co efflux regulator RcnB
MSKKQLVALAVAFAVLGTPLALAAPASAAPISTTSSPIFTDRDHEDEDDEDDEDEDDEDGWGHEDNHSLPPVVIRPHGDHDEYEDEDDDEEDDEGGFVLPSTPGAAPSVAPNISPYDSNSNATGANYSVSPLSPSVVPGSPTSPLSPNGSDQVVGANAINPDAAPAIDPASIRTTAKTPADVFMESATWGLVAMGAGALAIGSAAGVKSLSARRKPNADYFYDSEN